MDHVGSVDALVEKLGPANVELVSSARSLPLLQKPPDTSLLPGETQTRIKGGQGTGLLLEMFLNTPDYFPACDSFWNAAESVPLLAAIGSSVG